MHSFQCKISCLQNQQMLRAGFNPMCVSSAARFKNKINSPHEPLQLPEEFNVFC